MIKNKLTRRQNTILQILSKEEDRMAEHVNKSSKQVPKRGFSLPVTSAKPPMPPVKPPKKESNKK